MNVAVTDRRPDTASQTQLYYDNACEALSQVDFSMLGKAKPEVGTWTYQDYKIGESAKLEEGPSKLAAMLAAGPLASRSKCGYRRPPW